MDRKDRAKTQRIYLLESIPADPGNKYEREFVVSGSTGNVYNVTICDNPACTCPDYTTRYNRCKHIYFVLIRVMKCKNEDKETYTRTELINMFNNIPEIVIDPAYQKLYDQMKKQDGGEEIIVAQKATDDLCPVCLDDLENGEEVDFCKYSCGKPVHKICYDMWVRKKEKTCIYCRRAWEKKKVVKGDYLNILD